ncbi:MAG: PIN domain-containing protein [Defluviitaleaceae bacterium]|nr:PIN domain-containing protein [Defluviitaleaceae bacterium]
MNKIFVLDACALIALVKNEEGASVVSDVYKNANNGGVGLYMNRINLLEVYYGFYRDKGKDYALDIMKQVEASSVFISEFDRDILLEAGRLKATYKFSLADSIVIAQTILLNGSVLTADHHEFDVIEGKENLIFNWIR